MTAACPQCGATLRLSGPPQAGQRVRCPACSAVFAPPREEPLKAPPRAPPPAVPPPIAAPPRTPPVAAVPPVAPPASSPPGKPVLADDVWEVNRPDYQGVFFSVEELRDLVQRGWLDRSDSIRPAHETDWRIAGDEPALSAAFALQRKRDAARAADASEPPRCCNHPGRPAEYACDSCSRFYCGECGNETEIRQTPVVLCVECDVPMVPRVAS